MSVSHVIAPMRPSPGQRWLNRWWPSRRLHVDPVHDLRVDDRYVPVSIANWKLVPMVARHLLAARVVRPLSFAPNGRLTVVIPYRDREQHLLQLLPALKARLQEQRIHHRVLVVEQEPGALFNRGRLLNIGVHYAADSTDYYCLHDVDAVPIVANYSCPSQPLRLVSKISRADSDTRHAEYYFSGAVSIRKEQLFAANGFSNEYWGWGKEDDDFFFRLLLAGFLCYFDLQGAFQDLPNPSHQQVSRRRAFAPRYTRVNRRRRSRLLRGLEDPGQDGLNTLHYRVIERLDQPGFEKILVRW